MNKAEFIDIVAEKAYLTKGDAKAAVEAFLKTIEDTLVDRDTVSFVGFGTFSTAEREPRTARVPGTDKTVEVPKTTVAKFKVGKSLKTAIAGK